MKKTTEILMHNFNGIFFNYSISFEETDGKIMASVDELDEVKTMADTMDGAKIAIKAAINEYLEKQEKSGE
jgi:predicted RNase H-like HicB family nuclease